MAKQDAPVRINVSGAVVRQQTDFGDSAGFGEISGLDIAPFLPGLEGDLCQAPHWGYVSQGELAVPFADGNTEMTMGGDLLYWPPGHTVKVDQDAELILFSPQHEHSQVMDHMLRKMAGRDSGLAVSPETACPSRLLPPASGSRGGCSDYGCCAGPVSAVGIERCRIALPGRRWCLAAAKAESGAS